MCNMRTIGPAVSEKKIFEIVNDDGRTTDGRKPEHGYTISSPMSLRLRRAKNNDLCLGNVYSQAILMGPCLPIERPPFLVNVRWSQL